MFLKLRDDVRFVYSESTLIILSDEIFSITGLKIDPSFFLVSLQKGVKESEFKKTSLFVKDLYEFLTDNDLIVFDHRKIKETYEINRILYYLENYTFNPNTSFSSLKNKKVLILGLGGTGAIIYQHLLHNGVRNFTLIDNGYVDPPDLNRQYIYTRDSIGKQKIFEAKKYGETLFQDVNIEVGDITINSVNSMNELRLKAFDLVISAVDTPQNIIKIIGEFITQENYTFYDAGVGIHDGQFGPLLIPGKTLCPSCFARSLDKKMSKEERRARGIEGIPIKGSFGPTNSIIASFAAHECWHYLVGASKGSPLEGKQHYINFDNCSLDFAETNEVCSCWGC